LAEVFKFILFSDKSDDHNFEELSATAKRVDWVKLTRATIDYLSKADFIVKVHFMKSTGLILPASASILIGLAFNKLPEEDRKQIHNYIASVYTG